MILRKRGRARMKGREGRRQNFNWSGALMKHSKHVGGKKLKVNLEKGFNEIKSPSKVGRSKSKLERKETSAGRKWHTLS